MEKTKYSYALRVLRLVTVLIAIALMLYVLSGCSAQWHLQRAIIKNPDLLTTPQTVQIDTVIITQPVTLRDTVILRDVDSITITQNNVVTKLWRVHDTIRVQTLCPPDTVRITVTKKCPPVAQYKPLTWWQKNRWYLLIAGLFIAVSVIYKRITG